MPRQPPTLVALNSPCAVISHTLAQIAAMAASQEQFVEPPVAPPQPSYLDDRVPQQAVTSQMQALGTLPTKMKTRSQTKLEDTDNTPPPSHSIDSSDALNTIIDKVAEKAHSLEYPAIAIALKRIHELSATDTSYHQLLCNLIAQRATSQQALSLQTHIKQAKKEYREQNMAVQTRRSAKAAAAKATTATSSSDSGPAQAGKNDSAQSNTAVQSVETDNITTTKPKAKAAPKKASSNGKAVNMKADPSSTTQPVNRSSSSSLSSTHSDDAETAKVTTKENGSESAPPPESAARPKATASKRRKTATGTKKKAASKKTDNAKTQAQKSKKRKVDLMDVRGLESDGFDDTRQMLKKQMLTKFDDKFPESHVRENPYTGPMSTDNAPPAPNPTRPKFTDRTAQSAVRTKLRIGRAANGAGSSRQATPAATAAATTAATSSRPVRNVRTARVKMS